MSWDTGLPTPKPDEPAILALHAAENSASTCDSDTPRGPRQVSSPGRASVSCSESGVGGCGRPRHQDAVGLSCVSPGVTGPGAGSGWSGSPAWVAATPSNAGGPSSGRRPGKRSNLQLCPPKANADDAVAIAVMQGTHSSIRLAWASARPSLCPAPWQTHRGQVAGTPDVTKRDN